MAVGKKIADFGLWESHLEPGALFVKGRAPNYPFRHRKRLHWLQVLSDEYSGKTVLCRAGKVEDATGPEIVTPLPFDVSQNFNIRTRVNEYGGKCYCIINDCLVFNNYLDGCLYAQNLSQDALSGADVRMIDGHRYYTKAKGHDLPEKFAAWSDQPIPGFADLSASPDGKWIVAVMEIPNDEGGNECRIVKIRWRANASGKPGLQPIETLVSGADFYARPVISADGSRLAWMEWSHPHMPWDQTRLMCADLDLEASLSIRNKASIIDREGWAVCQIGFLENGELIFVSDNPECDFWNFYSCSAEGECRQISHERGEFGEVHWQFGQSRWQETADGVIAAILTERDGDRIIELNTKTSEIRPVTQHIAALNQISLDEDGLLSCMAYYENQVPSIVQVRHSGLDEVSIGGEDGFEIDHAPVSEFVEFATSREEVAYGLFLAPLNPGFTGPDSQRPPLIVMIHGGPTGRSSRVYEGIRHYYCSLGFAVLDVNHRGSTGFGRTYRQSLMGNWGIDDCEDIAAGIGYLIRKQRIDPELVFIRGGSAGGYAVQRALTRHNELFCAGASYYGIGNLITLSEITHRFESRYTDRLIGEAYDRDRARNPDSRYRQRSPIFEMDKLNCPLILFQGSDDKVVPPALSHEVVELLERKGIRHAYHEYAGEGHGFRNKATKLDAMDREIEFFTDIIREKRGMA
ncbi:MAG: prolyl oligopeptidase family serine peptidase [Gammaproteobacteria bacterium]|nr:prolyl oligopeptidase family serine peptidase [Gammaproteobacteria bacterium]